MICGHLCYKGNVPHCKKVFPGESNVKKKREKTKAPVIPLLSQDEERLLHSLLEDLGGVDPGRIRELILSPRMAQAFVERLPLMAPEVGPLVLAVRGAFPEKPVRKAVQKMIFRLKQRGVSTPEEEPPGSPGPVIKVMEQPQPSAFAGHIDGYGSRPIFIEAPQMPAGVDLAMGMVNDEQGLVEFVYGRYSRKRVKEIRQIFFQSVTPLVETTLGHAAAILERAYAAGEKTPNSAVEAYLKFRPWLLDHVSILERLAVSDLLAPGAASSEALTASRIKRLLDHALMASWIIPPEEIEPLVAEIIQAEESPILVSEPQRAERVSEIKEAAIARLFPEKKRLVLKYRLEEMAYVFIKLGQEPYADLSMAAALSLEEKDSLLKINPFLLEMMEKSLAFYARADEEAYGQKGPKQVPSSSIIIP